jgi:hypothetical protein
MSGSIPSFVKTGPDMPAPVVLPAGYNYIGVFLTLKCNLRCSYCINRFNGHLAEGRMLSGGEWITGLNRLASRADLPVSLQGGEPTLHPDFFAIVNGIKPELHIDLLTNLEVDLDRFMAEVGPSRIRREAPYASIRVSYHPEVMVIEELAARVLTLQDAGYHVGIWGVSHPDMQEKIARADAYCTALGIDFRTKEFLGERNGEVFGKLSFPDACDRQAPRQVQCRTTELLIGPGGDVFRCHADLYLGRNAVGHILDPLFAIDDSFRECGNFGNCNPCDVKLKTNRFQEFGHTSVEIVRMPD